MAAVSPGRRFARGRGLCAQSRPRSKSWYVRHDLSINFRLRSISVLAAVSVLVSVLIYVSVLVLVFG